VVDAVSYGLRPIVPFECVGDRAQEPHRWSIFDMDSKYADVEPLDDVLAALALRARGGGANPAEPAMAPGVG
jgi:maleamate amidohydrolase